MSSPALEREHRVPLFLLQGLGVADALLAVYQWAEVRAVERGETVTCAINETVNCATVWTSAFATNVHSLLHMPIAGLGLAWATTAVLLTINALRQPHPPPSVFAALKVWGLLGALASLVFAAVSASLHALCLTCLGTYVLVTAYAAIATAKLPGRPIPDMKDVKPALKWLAVFFTASFLACLVPDRLREAPKPVAKTETLTLESFLKDLSQSQKRQLIAARNAYKDTPIISNSDMTVRSRFGPADAKVRIVDWTDIACPHCRQLMEAFVQLKMLAGKHSLSIESRVFPLDSECNPLIKQSDGTGVRCLGAKLQVCVEGAPDEHELHEKLYRVPYPPTTESLYAAASSGSVSRTTLESCANSTLALGRILADVEYAKRLDPDGTPIVTLNERPVMPSGAFLLAMVLADGDINAAGFAALDKP